MAGIPNSLDVCPEPLRLYQFQCISNPAIWIPCHQNLPGRGNCSTWRVGEYNWWWCQIDFSFLLGCYLGIKPAGRWLEGNLPNSDHICNQFLRQMLPQEIWKQTGVLMCSFATWKGLEFYRKERKWKFTASLRCTESLYAAKQCKIVWK